MSRLRLRIQPLILVLPRRCASRGSERFDTTLKILNEFQSNQKAPFPHSIRWNPMQPILHRALTQGCGKCRRRFELHLDKPIGTEALTRRDDSLSSSIMVELQRWRVRTETFQPIIRKLLAILRPGHTVCIGRFGVLVVTPDPMRIETMIAACQRIERGHRLFLFVT